MERQKFRRLFAVRSHVGGYNPLVGVPILCYHKIGPVDLEGRRLNMEPKTLATHIRFFKRSGFRFTQAKDLTAWPRDRTVCLTFDDGYVSTLTYGLDVLRSLAAKASVYIVPGKVGQTSDWDFGHERPLASWDLLTKVPQDVVELGNHTLSHARLGDLESDEQVAEWLAAKAEAAKKGIHFESCCLPYGSWNASSVESVRQSGYQVCLGLSRRQARSDDNRLLLPRIVVGFSDKLPGLLYKLYIRPLLPGFHRKSYV